jgi:quercetin dioxygenase-like cupin family protein
MLRGMKLIKHDDAPVFDIPGATFTGYAAPSRGAAQVSMWFVELAGGSESALHAMDCEEVFVALDGRAVATVDGAEHAVEAGDCLILPAGSAFSFAVPEGQRFRAIAGMRAGGRATMIPDGTTVSPPWAE